MILQFRTIYQSTVVKKYGVILNLKSFYFFVSREFHCVLNNKGSCFLCLQFQSPLNVVAVVQFGIGGRGPSLLLGDHRLS
jgi:hypothetical protein